MIFFLWSSLIFFYMEEVWNSFWHSDLYYHRNTTNCKILLIPSPVWKLLFNLVVNDFVQTIFIDNKHLIDDYYT